MQRWAQKGQKWYGPNRAEDIKKRWQQYTEELTKEILMTQRTTVVLSLTKVRHPGMQTQVGLRKCHWEKS